MGIVTYPVAESEREQKVRERAHLPLKLFSFTVTGQDADMKDSLAAPAALQTMREILGRGTG